MTKTKTISKAKAEGIIGTTNELWDLPFGRYEIETLAEVKRSLDPAYANRRAEELRHLQGLFEAARALHPDVSRETPISRIAELSFDALKELLRRERRRRGERSPGQPSHWTREAIASAVAETLKELPGKHERTYSNVAVMLQKKFGDKAPKSGAALRVLLRRLDLDWKEIKNEG